MSTNVRFCSAMNKHTSQCICVRGAPSNATVLSMLHNVSGINFGTGPPLQEAARVSQQPLVNLLGDVLFPPLRRLIVAYWLGDMTNLLCIWHLVVDKMGLQFGAMHKCPAGI